MVLAFPLVVTAAILMTSFSYAGAQNGFMLTCQDSPVDSFACNADCNWSHNSSVGICDSNKNCVCNNDGLGTGQIPVIGGIVPVQAHCQSQQNAATIAVYNSFCDTDCLCVHGGANGVCDWTHKQCVCVYPPGFVWAGQDQPTCIAEKGFNVATCLAGALVTNQVPAGCGDG